jgi:hypothetical protein
MNVHSIVQRWTARPIVAVEATSAGAAVAVAVAEEASLLYADLRGADLAGRDLAAADLRGIDFRGGDASAAEFSWSDLRSARLDGCRFRDALLRGADLRQADLRDADFRHADLRHARLTGADLRGAVFARAKLAGAWLDWRWSTMPLELLRQHPAAAREGSRAVAELAFAGDERPFSWLKALMARGLASDWVLGVFAEHLRPGDNAPSLLRKLAADAPPLRSVVQAPALWTVRRPA